MIAPHLEGRVAALSFMSVGELLFGGMNQGWGQSKMNRLNRHIERFVILPADRSTVQLWAELKVQSQSLGRPKGSGDLWIAACAKRHSLPLLTGDRGFLDSLNIQVIDFRGER
ncbi:hypothetical protein BH23ACT12_BH23ACT12_21330 [soil metagenome]